MDAIHIPISDSLWITTDQKCRCVGKDYLFLSPKSSAMLFLHLSLSGHHQIGIDRWIGIALTVYPDFKQSLQFFVNPNVISGN